MPIVIKEHTPIKDLQKHLPMRFQKLNKPKLPNDALVTVITFNETVVHSRSLIHTLEKILPSTEQIVIYAENFTRESIKFMRNNGVFFDSIRDSEWTDENHIHIRIISGSAVKQRLVTKKDRSRNPH